MATVRQIPSELDQFLSTFKTRFRNIVRIVSTGDVSQARVVHAVQSAESLKRQLGRVSGTLIPTRDADELNGHLVEFLGEARHLLSGPPAASCSYTAPKVPIAGRGADRYLITKEQLYFFVRINLTAVQMAEALGVSESTVRRRLSEFDLKLRDYCDLSNDTLDNAIKDVIGLNRNVGAEGARARLSSQGIKVQRERVREAMDRVDPVGVALRALQPRLERSVYAVPGPNSLWHIDGNHKLIRYRIVIHGGIDGATRLLVFLKASGNNLAGTVLENFTRAVSEYGMPSRVRMDQGVENSDVSLIMELMRGFERGSAIRGRSCHNQRIERAWVDVWNGVTNVYYTLFAFLESRQLLDPSSELDLWLLHLVFLPRINNDLELFRGQWNHHGLSSEHGNTPQQLFALGMLKNRDSQLTAVRDVFNSDGVPDQPDDSTYPENLEHLLGRTRVDVPGIQCPLSAEQQEVVEATLNPGQQVADHGLSIYVRARRDVLTPYHVD